MYEQVPLACSGLSRRLLRCSKPSSRSTFLDIWRLAWWCSVLLDCLFYGLRLFQVREWLFVHAGIQGCVMLTPGGIARLTCHLALYSGLCRSDGAAQLQGPMGLVQGAGFFHLVQGLVKAVGVSNYGPRQLERIYTYLERRGIPLASAQACCMHCMLCLA